MIWPASKTHVVEAARDRVNIVLAKYIAKSDFMMWLATSH